MKNKFDIKYKVTYTAHLTKPTSEQAERLFGEFNQPKCQIQKFPVNLETTFDYNENAKAFIAYQLKKGKAFFPISGWAIVDYDNEQGDNIQMQDAIAKLQMANFSPSIAYESYSSTNEKPKWHLIYFYDPTNYTIDQCKSITAGVSNQVQALLNTQIDPSFARNHTQKIYGTNKPTFQYKQPDLTPQIETWIKTPPPPPKTAFKAPNKTANFQQVDLIYQLENQPYSAFKTQLMGHLETNQKVGWELGLRWVFSNHHSPQIQAQILGLMSEENQIKISKLLNQKPHDYWKNVCKPNGNFARLAQCKKCSVC